MAETIKACFDSFAFTTISQFPICVLVQVAVRVRPLIQREIDAGVGLLELSYTLARKISMKQVC